MLAQPVTALPVLQALEVGSVVVAVKLVQLVEVGVVEAFAAVEHVVDGVPVVELVLAGVEVVVDDEFVE